MPGPLTSHLSWEAANLTTANISHGDQMLVIFGTALVMFMTPGLAQFYGAQWYGWGFSLCFGGGNSFIGNGAFLGLANVGSQPTVDYGGTISLTVYCMYQLMFAIIAVSIVSGAIVERMSFRAWVIFAVFWTTLVYDFIAHWMWSAWLYPDTNNTGVVQAYGWLRAHGALDWAGGLAIHTAPGVSAFVACLLVGKRRSISHKKGTIKLSNLAHVVMGMLDPCHSPLLTVQGGSLLWFGWFGFNGAAGLKADAMAALAVANSQLSAAFAFFVFLCLDWIVKGQPTVIGGFSGVVVGLVAITPCAGYVPLQVSPAIGSFVALVCYGVLFLKERYLRDFFPGFDDTLDVATGHGVAGALGTLALGLVANTGSNPNGGNGVFYGGGFLLLGWQTVALCVVVAWSAIMTFFILLAVKFVVKLRVTEEEEVQGGDIQLEPIMRAEQSTTERDSRDDLCQAGSRPHSEMSEPEREPDSDVVPEKEEARSC